MILLDTHIWVWWVQGDERLTTQHKSLLYTYQPDGLGISLYSCWEVAKLVEYKRLTLPCSIEQWFGKSASLSWLSAIGTDASYRHRVYEVDRLS